MKMEMNSKKKKHHQNEEPKNSYEPSSQLINSIKKLPIKKEIIANKFSIKLFGYSIVYLFLIFFFAVIDKYI